MESIKPQKRRDLTYKFFQVYAWNDMIAGLKRFLNEDVLAHHYELVDVGLSVSAKTANENEALGYIIYDKNNLVEEQPTKMGIEFRKESETWKSTMNWLDKKAKEKGNRFFKHDMSLRQGDDNNYQVAAIFYWENRHYKAMKVAVDYIREKNWDDAFKAMQVKWASQYENNFKPIDVRLTPCCDGDCIISFSYTPCEGLTSHIAFKHYIINDTW